MSLVEQSKRLGIYTKREYTKRQCDKCVTYVDCEVLEEWLKLWRDGKQFRDFVSDGCDLAKICWKFKPREVS